MDELWTPEKMIGLLDKNLPLRRRCFQHLQLLRLVIVGVAPVDLGFENSMICVKFGLSAWGLQNHVKDSYRR